MIYLRTGANGSGKTLMTLQDVRKLQVESGRPVAWNGRFKLKPEKEQEFGWKRIDFKDWQVEPDGTIFLIDECHNDLPNRPASGAVPDHVRMLAEHRSRGFDFFLLTQHPMNMDAFVRKLIGAPGYHQHLKRMFGATDVSRVLQWDAVNPQCEKDGSGKTGQISTRMHPKEVYSWYDSAMLHTGKKRIPKQVWMLLGCALLVPALGYMAYQYVKPGGKMLGGPAPGAQPAGAGGIGAPPAAAPHVKTPLEYAADYRPRIAGLMHTAPAYDKLTEPRRVPVAAACVMSASKGCKCFTQDATPYPIDEAMCKGLVEHGTFYAFAPEGEMRREPAAVPMARQAPETAVAVPSGLTLMGDLPSVSSVAAPATDAQQPSRLASVGAGLKR